MRKFLALSLVVIAGCGGGMSKSVSKGVSVGELTAIVAPESHFVDFRGATAQPSLDVTVSIDEGGAIRATCVSGGPKTILLTLAASVDMSYADILYPALVPTPEKSINGVHASFRVGVLEGTTVFDGVFWSDSPLIRLHNVPREDRDQVTSIELRWTAPEGESNLVIGGLYWFGAWLSLPTDADPGGLLPAFNPLVYQASYYDTLTDTETALSPEVVIAPEMQASKGQFVRLSYPLADLPFDKVRFYRVITENDVTTRYRIAEVPHTDEPTALDMFPVDVVKTFPQYTP